MSLKVYYYNKGYMSHGVSNAYHANYNFVLIRIFAMDYCQTYRTETLGFNFITASANQFVRIFLYRNCTLAK